MSSSVALCLLSIIAFTSGIDGATVSYATTIKRGTQQQRNGSIEGGTLLWVYGTGFAPNEFSLVPTSETSNEIKLIRGSDTYDCTMHTEKCTDTQLTCYTPRLSAGNYQVRVYVQGNLVPLSQHSSPSAAMFTASTSNTPQITSISPASGLPGRLISLGGDFKTKCYLREGEGCTEGNVPVISRIYVGGQICNLMNGEEDGYYSDFNNTKLQCLLESREVGVFNVTLLVSDDYGRSSVDNSLYRMSGTGQLYNFESHAAITEISSESGSVEGGTILNIQGEYFGQSEQYPLEVTVGDDPCTIRSVEQNYIECQTPKVSSNNRNHYHGGRGLQIYSQPGYVDVVNLGSVNPPMPNSTANRTWTNQASFTSNFPSSSTVWFIGYLRSPITAAYYFRLDTNARVALYLSTNEDPVNKVRIATSINTDSNRIVLQNNTDYYLLCVGSMMSGGNFRMGIKAALKPLNTRTGTNSPGVSEIQRISIGGNLMSERQTITYTTNVSNVAVSEEQDVEAVYKTFQIGFRGAFTALLDGPPPVQKVQDALNDLPTIYPLAVSVSLVGSAYRVKFPAEMGDVPSLTVISVEYNQTRNSTELVQGVASGLHMAFQLDGGITSYFNFRDDNITNEMLISEFKTLFTIRCPVSLYNPQTSSSIVYAEDFESSGSFDESLDIRDMAFCGRGALRNSSQYLVRSNTATADYLCFAYKLASGLSITMNFLMENDGNAPVWENIPMNLLADSKWHYKCFKLDIMLQSYSPAYYSVTKFIVMEINLNSFAPSTVMIDTVTLRNDEPIGYESETVVAETDISTLGPCVFPFVYNGKSYLTCARDENDQPICSSNGNQKFLCHNSSIEGVRRLFPKNQLLEDTLQINHTASNQKIEIAFRYAACMSPSLIKVIPSTSGQVNSVSNASKPIDGYYSIMFDGQLYSPIPAAISGPNLANVFQSFSDFGYVSVSRTGQCHQYQYTIQWLVNGEQPLIVIANSSQVKPNNAPMSVTSIQHGSSVNVFYNLPDDILRTYHTVPQVEVVVGGYSSYCGKQNNSCDFERSISNTPQITSMTQSGNTVTLQGTGFSNNLGSNMVSIGEGGSCTVQAANETYIRCSIIDAPSGQHILQLNVADKGLASCNNTLFVNVPLTITSFAPSGGDCGGGFPLSIVGSGFSTNAVVKLGVNFCINTTVIDFTHIQCIVPPSTSGSVGQVQVTVIDGISSTNAATQFRYNATTVPTITSINPKYVTMRRGILNINGTGFGTGDVSVLIDTKKANVISSSNNLIVVDLPSLPPGLHPITVRTSSGYARPLFHIEYRFYVQEISPRVGSAYGGNDLYLNGFGFENGTRIQLRDSNNRIAPCNIISVQSTQIHCQTTAMTHEATITAYGTHPTFGFGYSWLPIRQTVQQGTLVTWYWDSTQLLTPVNYRLQQVENAYSTTPVINGFDSGSPSSLGSFSYRFDTVGTFYYWAPNVHPSSGYSMRGAVEVVPIQSETFTVEAVWDKFTAQTCSFPFIFNGANYTACTTVNDTQPWCSPTATYTGQRLYCTPTVTIPTPSCSSTPLNVSACGLTAPSALTPDEYLSTTCTIESVTSLSPTEGPAGTVLNISGSGFQGSMCDYDVQIGSSYRCPIVSMTSNQILCQIGTGSMLDPRVRHAVRVVRQRRGYLANENSLEFSFQPSIFNITPNIGSTAGGTRVTIQGDGFINNDTLLFIVGNNFTHEGATSYSQIVFDTPRETAFVNMNLTMVVFVSDVDAVCNLPSCEFAWISSITPHFYSISPSLIRGMTNITINGSNLLTGGRTSANAHVEINDNPCNITQMTNTMIRCTIMGVEAGRHPVEGFIDGVGNVDSLINITSDAFISTVTPSTSGIYGGAKLTIDGHGFSSNISEIRINVGPSSCPVVEASESEIRCIIPPQGNGPNTANIQITSHNISFPSSYSLNYSRIITPNITSISPTVGSSAQSVVITGNNFVGIGQTKVTVDETPCNITSRSMTSITCTIGPTLSAGNHSVIVNVEEVGDSNENVIYRHDLTINTATPSEGSYGGGLESSILGNGFNGTDVSVTVCNRSCLSENIVSNEELVCVTPPLTMVSGNTLCNMTVVVDGVKKETPFTYKQNLTATLTGVGPKRGGTGGGTLITINGTGFSTTPGAVTVTIAETPCLVRTVTQTTITCETGSHRYSSVKAPIMVSINGSGYAVGPAYFQYIDLWSSRYTWGGEEPPEEGSLVVIEHNETIYLDIETPLLKALIIDNATLIFEDSQDVALNAEYIILVNGGRLQVGTESEPFQHRGVINIHGHSRSIELPIYGAKVLAIRDGALDMHGIPTVRTWTRLGATANNGSSTITLMENVNWTIGSQIVIATTSDRFSQKESELRRIKNISSNGLVLTLDKPLNYTHLGITRMVNSTMLEIRAEVGLLSHNVIFQGSITESWDETIEACPGGFNPDEFAVQTCYLGRYGQEVGSDQFGAMITINQDGNQTNGTQRVAVRLSNVEIFHVGQAFRLDRYAIHFQRNGNMSDSYVKSSSIYESYNRAIHIQACDYITIENNVIYNIMGNAFFIADGIEVGHVFRGNLAVFVKTSSSLLNEDLTPAAFWLSNPNNTVELNAVAGTTHYGYWYRFGSEPEGLSQIAMPNFCPNRQPFGRFYNNSVHSTGRFGVWIYPEYAPTLTGDCNGTNPTQANIEGLIAWRNNKGIEVVMSRTIQIKNALVFDNADMGIAYITAYGHQDTNPPYIRPTFYNSMNGSLIIDSAIIGDAGISATPVVPKTAGLVVAWDRGLRVRNVAFMNFPTNETRAISGPIILDRCTDRCGGWQTAFSNISFINVLVRGRFRWAYDGIYHDEDGSLSGTPNSMIMAPDGLTNTSSFCSPLPVFENAIRCSRSQGAWLRFGLQEKLNNSLGRLFIYNNLNASTIVPWLHEQLTHENGYTVVVRANQTYTFSFETLITSDIMRYQGVIYDVAPGDFVIIQHLMTALPFKANTTIDRQMILGVSSPLGGTNSSNGDWYYDFANKIFSYIVLNPSTANASVDIQLSYQIYVCPCNGCGCPPTTTTSTTSTTSTSRTTQTTTSATTTTTTSATTTTTTSATTTTTTSATTTTTTSATTTTTTSVTTTTTTSVTTTSTTTTTTTMYLPPIQPCNELPTSSQLCQSITVRYWSINSHWTFGPQDYTSFTGIPPSDGKNVFVPRCIWLIIDQSPLPRLGALRIDGVVEFKQNMNHVMNVDMIIINGGRLIAGLPTAPFNGTVDIVMTKNFPITIQLPSGMPAMERKMIGVLGGLDLNGKPRGITWTRIAATASAGQNTIILSQAVNWVIGDQIVITTTDTNVYHTERHTIANIVNGTIITTGTPLANNHLFIRQTFANGRTVTVAAAVGLLSHNVRVINQNTGSSNDMAGFRIFTTLYNTNVYHIYSNAWLNACYKGYLRVSYTQFIGFGVLDDSYNTDQRAGIYLDRLGDYNPNRPTYVTSSSFDGGFNAAISMIGTNIIPITNNVVYNTYRTALVITGTNSLVQNNLVTSVYWLGTGQPLPIAEFNFNNDGAITTKDVTSVRLLDNMVVGAERVAYRVHGDTCGGPDIFVPPNITNVYSNNEAHCVMSGVNMWPSDKGFLYDRKCVLIKTFKVYKAWYYAFYINNPRNITISSCTAIDSHVGMFTYVVGPAALTHIAIASRVTVTDSIVIGSITPQDCADTIDRTSVNIRMAQMAIPGVSDNSSYNGTSGRSGIVFPTVSRNNYMPLRSWTGIGVYPCLNGLMTITNTTLAYFNDTCGRHDVAIQVSQKNDDGQFPITTRAMSVYNTPENNIIFNGPPNLGVVNPSRCGDMDCDGLKKNLLTDTDGSLIGHPSSIFSHAESLWGSQSHGIGDFRIPREAYTNSTGHRMNVSMNYPYRGISRTNSCSLRPNWGMYLCNASTDYRMLIIESMDSDTEKRRLSPVALMSRTGYIDLINGPQDQTFCNGYSCRKRISTFMAIIQSLQTYEIYLSSTPPKWLRFRILNADPSIKCILALYYYSLQQIDVYANSQYISPTNRNLLAPVMMLLDQPNGVTLSSPPGSNYFHRPTQLAYFLVSGNTTVDVRIAPLLILSFGFPVMNHSTFFGSNFVSNVAAILNVNPDKIRRVTIVSASSSIRVKRQSSSGSGSVRLQLELRDEPRPSTTVATGIGAEILSNIAAIIINRYQAGELQEAWILRNLTHGLYPTNLTSKEPFDDFENSLSVIQRLELIIPPSDCRQQSPCTIQPILIAYDAQNNTIQKLGSNDQPWQIKATLVNNSNIVLGGAIANYTGGQSQYSLLSLPDNGTYQVQFTIIQPYGVNGTFFSLRNLTAVTAPITVTKAILAGRQVNNIYVVNTNEIFSISVMPIDSVTKLRLGQIQWGTWRWLANASLYSLPNFNRVGTLVVNSTSRTVVNLVARTVTVTSLGINGTGMYILQMQMTSTNNEHNVFVTTNGILAKDPKGTFVTDPEAYSSNITFAGDLDLLNATDQLEITRAQFYNYLLSIGMPLISDMIFMKGDNGTIVAIFEVDSWPTNVSNAVSSILSNPSVVPGLSVLSVNINTRTYTIPTTPSTTTAPMKNDNTSNTALIIGLVVGLVAGLALIGTGAGCIIHKYNQSKNRLVPTDQSTKPDITISDVNESGGAPNIPTQVKLIKIMNPP